jgi:hypothetical protein
MGKNEKGRGSGPKLRYYLGICLEGGEKPEESSVRTVGVPAEIRTGKLPNMTEALPLEPTCSVKCNRNFYRVLTMVYNTELMGVRTLSIVQILNN